LGRYYIFILFENNQDCKDYQEEFHRLWQRENILRNRNLKNRGLNQDDQQEYDEIRGVMTDLRKLGQWVKMSSELGLNPRH
jgi:hypothetical protein